MKNGTSEARQKALEARLEKIAEQLRRGWLTIEAADRMMSSEIAAAYAMAQAESWERPALDERAAYRYKWRILAEATE